MRSPVSMSWIPYQVLIWLSAAGVLATALVQSPAAAIPGHVEAWGYNFFGQTTVPAGLEDVISIAAGGQHSVALRANGTVIEWGANSAGHPVPQGLGNVIAIDAATHSVALKSDGTVVVWGNSLAAVTNPPPGLNAVKSIAAGNIAGNAYTLALRSNGTVVAWGIEQSATNVPPGLSNIVEVAAGNSHVLALKSDGTVIAWGDNFQGRATPPPALSNVVGVRAGQSSSLAIKSDGTVVMWGSFDPVPAGLEGVVDVQFGAQHALALRSNGEVVAWGYNSDGQGAVPKAGNGITAIAAGGNHNLVLTARPRIFSISSAATANVGDTVTFSVNATGGALSYQWRRNSANLANQTGSSVTLANVQAADAGTYDVLVSNTFGTVASPPTSLSFAPPQITSQPQSITRYRGESAAFSVSASGLAPLTYQWLKAAVSLPGQTSTTLTLTNLASSNAGSYRVTVTDAAGSSATSLPATLSISDPTGTNSSFTFLPVLDTSIFSSGGNPRGVLTILAGTRDNGIRDRGLLRFDLSSLPRSALIESARLRLTVTGVPRSPPAANFHFHRMLKPWASDATWVSATAGVPWAAPGAQAGTDYSSLNSATCLVTLGGAFDFGPSAQLAADIQTWLTDPAKNYGWILKAENELLAQSARHFGSSESTQPPQLILRMLASARLTNVLMQPQHFTFTFDTVDGWFHRVQSAATLESGAWTTLTNVPAGPPRSIGVSVPLTHTGRFFRVISE
jgi:hypothetical protein